MLESNAATRGHESRRRTRQSRVGSHIENCCRCTKDIASFCRAICDAAKGFGTGVTPDGYSIDVARLTNWTDAERLTYDEVDDDS